MLLVFGAASAFGQLTEREREGFRESLYLANLKPEDIITDRNPFPGLNLPKLIQNALRDPLATTDRLTSIHQSAATATISELLKSNLADAADLHPKFEAPALTPARNDLPAPLNEIVGRLAAEVAAADAEIREALSALKPAELRRLIEGLPSQAIEEPRIKLAFVRSSPASLAECRTLLARVDLNRIAQAGWRVQRAAEQAYTDLADTMPNLEGKQRFEIAGLPVIIAGKGADVHDEVDARITIDLGGDDQYTGRAGAGVGYSSVLIDLGGDDRYDVPDLSIGAGVLGVGVAIDGGGNDLLRGQSLCFGSGVGGIGTFTKVKGNDFYSSVAGSQGFGMLGAGVCLDTGGDDVYRLSLMGQGAGRLQGLGWQIDRAGNDTYRAGGLIMNQPLFTDVSYSFAQGFGMGFREDSGGLPGGVGLLTDIAGHDAYLAETYAQAASYWFGLGSLYDAAGNDHYNGYHYVQASAMHITAAYLLDLAGNDCYTTQYGAAQAIGHDYGLAMLYDRAGDDLYAARDARPATAVANGISIFLESAGNDRYADPPAYARRDRAMISLSIFCDLGGTDSYPDPFGQGFALIENTVSIRDDQLEPMVAPSGGASTPQPPQADPQPGSIKYPGETRMAELYRIASQWGVGSATDEVNAAIREIIGIGKPAFEWMVQNRLAGANRLQIRAWARIANGIGANAIGLLGSRALGGSEAELEAVIRIGIEGRIQDIAALLPATIKDRPSLRLLAIRAAGALKARAASDAILPMLFQADPILVRTAIVALADIGDPNSIGTASTLLKSRDPFVRDAAIRLIASDPAQASSIGQSLADGDDEEAARTGLMLLGSIDMYNSLERIALALDDPRPGVRITALQLLNGRCPEASKEKMLALRDDPYPAVARVARAVNP